jgi:hypothetical protein
MIYLVCVFAGILAGGIAAVLVMERLSRRRPAPADLKTLRWERAEPRLASPALRCLRRHYPTHDLVTGVPLLDLMHTTGPHADEVARRCAGWAVGVAMVEKRSGSLSRLIVWSGDPAGEEKAWLLRRVGYRVTVLDENGTESGLIDVMSA